MFSIDQNSHSLWDTLPKLQALVRQGRPVRHFIEDIDVAFTSLGADAESRDLRLARESFHRSGGQDWGAALFYSRFLGRLPVEIRDWEDLTGLKTRSLARELGRTVDELYEQFSPGDTWQLIGPSYVGDRLHHRLIGDLTVAETADFLRLILSKAREDMLEAFPSPESRRRILAWLEAESARLERLIDLCRGEHLPELYRHWLREHLGERVELGLTSSLLAVDGEPDRFAPLEAFTRDYETAAGLYNEALKETDSDLHPLNVAEGELPFFAVLTHRDRLVRVPVRLREGRLLAADLSLSLGAGGRLPLAALARAGVRCLAGKAIVLALQVRAGASAEPLVLPHRGSLYMPAARLLERKLASRGLLPPLQPVVRVRFHLLDRMASLRTPIHLPAHLSAALGRPELPACELAARWRKTSDEATRRLRSFRDPPARASWQQETFPEPFRQMVEWDCRRRELAQTAPKSPEIRQVWKRIKALRVEVLEGTLRQIDRDTQVSQIEYWDSRGALLPWCVALGGEGFYDELLERAEIREEPPPGD